MTRPATVAAVAAFAAGTVLGGAAVVQARAERDATAARLAADRATVATAARVAADPSAHRRRADEALRLVPTRPEVDLLVAQVGEAAAAAGLRVLAGGAPPDPDASRDGAPGPEVELVVRGEPARVTDLVARVPRLARAAAVTSMAVTVEADGQLTARLAVRAATLAEGAVPARPAAGSGGVAR